MGGGGGGGGGGMGMGSSGALLFVKVGSYYLLLIVPVMEKARTMTLCHSLEHHWFLMPKKKEDYLLAGEEINLNQVGLVMSFNSLL